MVNRIQIILLFVLSFFAGFNVHSEINPLRGSRIVPGIVRYEQEEAEQEQYYWCWASLTKTFAKIRNQNISQCEIVDKEFGRKGNASCCLKKNASKEGFGTCNVRFINNAARLNQVLGFSALNQVQSLYLNKKPTGGKISGCANWETKAVKDCRKLTHLGNIDQGRLTAQDLQAHVESGRPVGLFFQFNDYATGHYVWISGIFDYQGGKPRYLLNDPYPLLFHQSIVDRFYRVVTYEQLVAGDRTQVEGIWVDAKWIATGVGKSKTDK